MCEQPAQAFQSWVLEQASFFEEFIDDYAPIHHRSLSIDDIKRKFLCNPPGYDAVFLLTFTVARLREIGSLPGQAKRNPFTGQIQLNLLFDLLLVVDVTIRKKNSGQSKFSEQARFLLDSTGHRLTQAQFEEVHRQFKSHFEAALQGALDGTIKAHSLALDRMQCDVALAYELRNRGAHEVETLPTIWNDFDRVQRAIFRTLCASIDYLY